MLTVLYVTALLRLLTCAHARYTVVETIDVFSDRCRSRLVLLAAAFQPRCGLAEAGFVGGNGVFQSRNWRRW